MTDIVVPTEGRQTQPTDPNDLVGVDSNAFAIVGNVRLMLKRAGASKQFIESFTKEATSGDYDHVIATAMAYLDAEPIEP